MRMTRFLLAGLVMAMMPFCLAADEKADGAKADGAKVTCGQAVMKAGEAKVLFSMQLGKGDKECAGVAPWVVPEGKAKDGFSPFINMRAPKADGKKTESYVFFPVTSGKTYEVRITMMYLDAAGEEKLEKGSMKFKAP